VVQGDWCIISGTTGYNYQPMAMPHNVEAQTRNTLATIKAAFEEADFALNEVVRTQCFVTEASCSDLVPRL
jgi:enamine deaminase RidA (YjgF/YER057c/UK114 family)